MDRDESGQIQETETFWAFYMDGRDLHLRNLLLSQARELDQKWKQLGLQPVFRLDAVLTGSALFTKP